MSVPAPGACSPTVDGALEACPSRAASYPARSTPVKPLTQFQQRVLDWLRSKRHLPQGICHATKTMAAWFKCSESYVRKTLKALIDRGLITRQWNYALRTRRKFRLPDQAPEPSLFPVNEIVDAPSMTGQESHQSRDNSPVTSVPPLDPPIDGPGGNTSLAAGATAPPQEVSRVLDKARKTVPGDPSFVARVKGLLRDWSLPRIEVALERLASKMRRESVPSPAGYLYRTLDGLRRDGVDPLSPADRAEKRHRFFAELGARCAARAAGGGT